jgi:hypothetical protein
VTPTMAEWRKVENTVSDGPGQERTETSYVFGAEYDGVFVPAITKASGYFEHLLDRGRQDAQNAQDAQQAQQGQSDQGGTASATAGTTQATGTTQSGSTTQGA